MAFYRFKHALVQDTAYESLLRSSRGPIHAKIADALKRLVPDVELTGPELLGHHYAQAGLIEQAAEYYRRAGEQSIERSAISEARAHLERGLGLARSMPDSPTGYALEARLSLALGSVSIITEGYGGAELAVRIDNSVALARQADQRSLLIRALFGEWAFKVHTGDLTKALDVAREMVALSELEEDATVRIVAATSLGINYAYFGRFLEARELFEKCLAEPEIAKTGGLGSPHPQDQEVLARTYLSRTLSCLGEIERGSEEARRSIERARKLGHHPSLAMALTMACRQAWLIRDEGVVRQRAAELITLAEEQGFPYWLARGRCYAGWVAVAQGHVEEGLRLLKQALSHLETTDVAMGNIAGLVGDAYLRAGLFEPALRYIDEALRVATKTDESWMDAELHRLKGVILRALPGHPANVAEAHFLRALDIARSQAARLWELRTATDLARLWLQEHKLMEASRLLDEVRSVSPIGGSAADLAEIESLAKDLAKLSGASVGGPPILHAPEGPNVS